MKKITIQLLALFSFCQTLGSKKSKQSKKILAEIQGIFSDDKGWEIEVGGQLTTDLMTQVLLFLCVDTGLEHSVYGHSQTNHYPEYG